MSFVIRCGVAPRAVIARRPRLAQLDNDDDLIPPDFGTKESVENVFIYFVFVIIFYISLSLFFLYFFHMYFTAVELENVAVYRTARGLSGEKR